jgi:hypothetical protein
MVIEMQFIGYTGYITHDEGATMTSGTAEERLLKDLEQHLASVWPQVMLEWQATVKSASKDKRAVALVTRRCAECDTTVRVGAILNRLTPNAPAGTRAYCSTCRIVTESPISEIRGIVVSERSAEDR